MATYQLNFYLQIFSVRSKPKGEKVLGELFRDRSHLHAAADGYMESGEREIESAFLYLCQLMSVAGNLALFENSIRIIYTLAV